MFMWSPNCSQVARYCDPLQLPQRAIRSPLMQTPGFERFSRVDGSVDHVWVEMLKDCTVSTTLPSQFPPRTYSQI